MNAIQQMVYVLTTSKEEQTKAVEQIMTEYEGNAVQYLRSNAK